MARLTSGQQDNAKSFILEFLSAAGVKTAKVDDVYGSFSWNYRTCSRILDLITTRSWDFDQIVQELSAFDGHQFPETIGVSKMTSKPISMLVSYLAYMCSNSGIYWNNSTKSANEMEQYVRNNIFAAALQDYGCFTVNHNVQAARTIGGSTTTPTTQASRTRAASTTGAGNPPKNNYKQSGPQSQNCRDLIGQPHQKASFNGTLAYALEADKGAKKVVPAIYTRPLEAAGEKNGTNKVFLGSANGYTYCTLYFQSIQDADTFLGKCKHLDNTGTLHVVKKSVSSAGYFQINTEFGPAYIVANKLNEEVETKVESTTDVDDTESTFVENIDKFSEVFMKYDV